MTFSRANLAVLGWAVAAAAISFSSPIDEFELRMLDLQFQALRGSITAPTDERVVVVGIDTASVDAIAEPMGLWHGYLAKFLDALVEAKPAIVAFDIVMPDRSFEGVAPGLDRSLLRSLLLSRKAYPTILAITIKEDGVPRGIHPSFITAAGTRPAYAIFPVDGDGRIRRFERSLSLPGEKESLPLAAETARQLGIPAKSGFVNFALGRNFDYVPFKDVLAAFQSGDQAYLAKHFRDRVVMLGVVLPYLDSMRAPVMLKSWESPDRETPGVLMHAQAMRSILADRMVQPYGDWTVALVTLLAALVGLLATGPWRAGFLATAMLIAFPAASLMLLRNSQFLPFAWPLAAGLVGVGLRQGADVLARLAERRKLRNSFGGYVSPDVMQQIVEGKISPDMDGVNMEVCVMFTDIRGYTTLSEGKQPHEILSLLNRYFDRMVEAIHVEEGTVVSFMGDGIMAVFGAPKILPNPCEAGFRSALRMMEGVKDFNADIAKDGLAPIAIGVGLHLGVAVVGHVGSKTRHDFTAIGDVTNVASRLESSTKEAGYRIVMSKEVADKLVDRSKLVPLGPVSLKGHTPVDSFGYERAEDAPKKAAPA